MRAATARPPIRTGEIGLLGLGGGLVALALVLLLSARGGAGSSPTAAPLTDPYQATNGDIAFWEQRAHDDPADFTALNHLASAYIQRGRETGDVSAYSSAEAATQASLATLPGDNYTAYATEAYLKNVRHDFAGSLETAKKAMTLDPGNPYAPMVIGDDELALGQYDAAFDGYQKLVAQAPDYSTFARLAQAYEIRGDLPNAEGAWKNAVELDPGTNAEGSAWVRTQYGNFLFNQGRANDAETQYEGALAAFPGYIHALAGQANVAAANGDYARAIALDTDVTNRVPLPQYVAALGDIYATAGQQDKAQKQYDLIGAIEQLYQANGINTDLLMSLFFADHNTNIDQAVQQAMGALQVQPDSIYSADAAGWALYKAGRFSDALPYAQRALAQGTQDASIHYHAGMIDKALGNTAAARDELSRALAINPHFSPLLAPIAQQALEELGG